MGSGASADVATQVAAASSDELKTAIDGLSAEDRAKVTEAMAGMGGAAAAAAPAAAKNAAFVFIKPHAVTEKVKELAKKGLEAKGITILAEGSLNGETIDKKQLIDNHYYAIAVKATIKKPTELNVPNDKFKAQFGVDWEEALKSGKVFNALDGCAELGVDADGMAAAWDVAKDEKKLVKLGGGFYCGLCKGKVGDEEKELYIMNGFFMAMRSKFTKPESEIYYYNVEWDASACSWADFRGKVLGPTDPSAAPEDSLRGIIFKDWEALGLKKCPNTGDNGMHASASPFEGLAERKNWLEKPLADDIFGKQLIAGGMTEAMIGDWAVDAQVVIKVEGEDKSKGSIFDQLEDIDSADCLAKMLDLVKLQ